MSVVEALARLAVLKRRCPPAQPRRLFNDDDPNMPRQAGSRSESSAAGTDHDDVAVSVEGYGHGAAPTRCEGPGALAPGEAHVRVG